MKRMLIVIPFLLFFSAIAMAKLTMEVNPTTVSINDPVTLTLTSTETQNQGQPNISVLEKDFNVISTEHRVNYTFINGVAQSNNEWTFILYPKRTGTITIPPLSIGKEVATSGSTVVITGANAAPTNTPSDSSQSSNTVIENPAEVFIKTSTQTKTSYVHAQILYTVKVFNRRHLIDVDYSPPEANNALILPLDQSKHYQTTVGSNVYAVEELKYAIFPHKSGPLTIQGPKLKAIMYDLIPEHVRIKGEALQVNIKPAPAHIASFLPALGFTITEQIDPPHFELSQGATLTRIITMKAVGVPASLIPTLKFSGQGFSTYPSPPELKNDASGQGIVGTSVIRVTYLFNTPGSHTIPSIEIPWFNTQTQKLETAVLPPRTFTIKPEKIEAASITIPQPKELNTVFGLSNPVTIWMTTTLILVLILATLLIKRLLSKPKIRGLEPEQKTPTSPSETSMRQMKHQLKEACLKHNPKAAAQALLQWASGKWPHVQFLHLRQVNEHCKDPKMSREIDLLTEALYRQMTPQPWNGEGLWRAFEQYVSRKQDRKVTKRRLPELNPR